MGGGKRCDISWTLFFFRAEKKESQKCWDSSFSQHFPPISGTQFFSSELKYFDSSLLPLVYWSQGFGYGFLTCDGIIFCYGQNFLKL